MRKWISMLLIGALTSTTWPAFAQDEGPTQEELEAATRAFREAQKRYEGKDYQGALEHARMAHEVSDSPNARLYIARSLRELGKLAEAYDEMSIVLRESTDRAQTEPKYEPTRDAAAAELALLARKIGRVTIAIADPPPGAKVSIGGKPVDSERLGQPIAVMPGQIVVRAEAPDQQPIERKLTLAAGDTKTLALAFGAGANDADEPAEDQTPADSDPRQDASGGGVPLRTIGFVAAGVGVAGLAAFAIAGSMAKSEFDTLEEECGSARCTDPKYADNVDSGKRMQTIANIGLIVGAVGVVAGGTLIVLGGPSKKEGAGLLVMPGSLGVGYRGRF